MFPFVVRYRKFPSRHELFSQWKPFLLVLFLRNIFGFLVFTWALLMTSSAKVMFLTKVEPYLVLFLHWLLYNERIPRNDLLLLLVHVLGAILLSTGGEFHLQIEQMGDLLVFLGILANSLMYRPGKILADAWGASTVTVLSGFAAGLLLLPFAIFFQSADFAWTASHQIGFSYLLLTVVIYYVISSTLWFYSLQGVAAWLNSALRCVGPVVAAPLAYFLFGKTLTFSQLLGASIVILTSLLLLRSNRKV